MVNRSKHWPIDSTGLSIDRSITLSQSKDAKNLLPLPIALFSQSRDMSS